MAKCDYDMAGLYSHCYEKAEILISISHQILSMIYELPQCNWHWLITDKPVSVPSISVKFKVLYTN